MVNTQYVVVLPTYLTTAGLVSIHHLIIAVGDTIVSGQVSIAPLASGMVLCCYALVAVRLELTTTSWGLWMFTTGHACTLYVNSLWFDTTLSRHLNPLWKS